MTQHPLMPGVLRSAPRGRGFAFVTLDAGGEVFLPVEAVAKSGLRYEDIGARVLVKYGTPDAHGRPRAFYVCRDLSDVEGEEPDPVEALMLRMLSKLERSVGAIEQAMYDRGLGDSMTSLGGE